VVAIFEKAEAAVGPVFDMSDIATDPHYAARNMIQVVGDTPMQGLIAALSKTPGVLRHEGPAIDADRDDITTRGWKN
jgi:crotonobetainyl-CoA:carnitine CoA-transferase CaiB-like acyl-CoA transferase